MTFTILTTDEKLPDAAQGQAFLVTENKEDWGKSTTRYVLIIFDADSAQHMIGEVRIGRIGMKKARRRADLKREFKKIDDDCFSLGQDDSYYERLKDLGDSLRRKVLSALRDMAADEKIYEAAVAEPVALESLLETVSGATAQGQFRRLAKGGARLTSYRIKYTGPKRDADLGIKLPPLHLDFEVKHASAPPSNIHVLIGQNGVGKTRVLEWMTRALLYGPDQAEVNGVFEVLGNKDEEGTFAGVVSVTFSAFDPFEPLPDVHGETDRIRYSYVGLKNTSKNVIGKGVPKNLKTLTVDFSKSLRECTVGAKAERWRDAVRMLESDAMFKQNNVLELLDGFGDEDEQLPDMKAAYDELADKATELFLRMSTGHKIVLLTITRLVETVEERTLILFDEPESHLHPPLLSAFIRAISNLLINRNGVAVLATHSPVVLQEVPASCVWKLQRFGTKVKPERPEIETFGENVGVLTREVFRLETTQSGFHKLLADAVDHGADYDAVVAAFSNQLGAEAKSLIRTLIATRKQNAGGEE